MAPKERVWSKEVSPVSVFPAKILVATDASKEAQLAASTAAELSARTDSELHIIHVGEVPLVYHPERHGGYHVDYERAETQARELLEAQVQKVKAPGLRWRRHTRRWEERTKRSWSWQKAWASG